MSAKIYILLALLALQSFHAAAQTIPLPTETIAIAAAAPYRTTGELFILKSDPARPNLRCPVLMVEGFDADNSMDWNVLYTMMSRENLIFDILAHERDLLVLNFDDATADILDTAALVQSALVYIRDHRANPNDKFIAVGPSHGGLALRKALVDMPDHGVDTWISFDAPHYGANIPLGLQKFFEYFGAINRSEFDGVRAYKTVLDSLAAQQMLITHYNATPANASARASSKRAPFIAAMDATGWPTNCKSIAISNGSISQFQPFTPGQQIISWNHNGNGLTTPKITANIYALPVSEKNAGTVFEGLFKVLVYGKKAVTAKSYSPLSLDNGPGGYRPSFYQLFENLPANLLTGGDDWCAYTNHCFIPTLSSLGIPLNYIASNLTTHAELAALSPFDEIHLADRNEEHVEINAHNKPWFIRALLEGYDSDNDGLDDYQEYLIGTDFNSAQSKLQAVVQIESIDGQRLYWNTHPNTHYEVWHTDVLDDPEHHPWQRLETFPPGTGGEYTIDPVTAVGFFRLIATPIDPITN